MLPLVNIHTHRKPSSREEAVRYAWLPPLGWNLDTLPYAFSVGLHPWWAQRYPNHEIGARLVRYLNTEKVKAVGEIGLDRVNGPEFFLQEQVFRQQFELATSFNLPVIVHCVRAYADMSAYAKRSYVPLIFHDYHGNAETTQQFLRFDTVYFSLGKLLFRNPKSAAALLKQIPRHRLFLETDTMPISIGNVYESAAALMGTDKEELALQVWENYREVLK